MKYLTFIFVLTLLLPGVALARHKTRYTVPPPPPPILPTPSPQTLVTGAFNADVGTVRAVFIDFNDPPPCFYPKITFIWWENLRTPTRDIASGLHDQTIRNFTAKLCPNTIVAPFHEMNLLEPQITWAGQPENIKTAWKRIHGIIGGKAKMAWVINNWTTPNSPPISSYYPGAQYVDIIGIDGFQWSNETFSQVIEPGYSEVKNMGKPIWIPSFGVQRNHVAWLQDAIKVSKEKGIQGLIYFNYERWILPPEGLNVLRQ